MGGSGEAMTGSLLERLRVPCATADSKEAADEMERLLAALAEIEEGKGRYSLDRLGRVKRDRGHEGILPAALD